MASPFRTCSPVAADRPNSKANGNNSLRKSFNVNVLPKAPPSRNTNQSTFTPANSPADYPQRASPFKDFNSPARQSEEIGLENVRPCPPKSAAAKLPTPKGMKNFMAPTFSAASKIASPKKRVLAERNEMVPSQTAAKTPAKSPSVFPTPHFMDVPAPCEPMTEDTHMKENEEAPIDCMEVDQVRSVPEPEIINVVRRVLFEVPEASEDNDSLSFLSRFPDPGEECTSVLPPYDPKRNYLSPRPEFLRYRPNRGLDIDSTEDEEGFGKHEFFDSETPPESVVTDVKEMESLGERMAAVGKSTEDLGHGEMHEEIQAKMTPVGNSEQNPCKSNLGFEPKKNALEQVEATSDNYDEEEEEQKQDSGWLRTSLLVSFIFLCASVAILGSGSPGLLPPSLHDNALARGDFYGSAVITIKGLDMIWRRSSVKYVGSYVLDYSRMKYQIIVKNVKSWFVSSGSKQEMRTDFSMEDVLQNSFQNSQSGDTEETCGILGMGIHLEKDTKSEILPSEFLVGSVGGEHMEGEESSREAILEAFDYNPVKDVSQIPSVVDSILDNVQVNTHFDVFDKNLNPQLPLPFDLLEDKNRVGVHGIEDITAFSSSSLEVYADLEEPFFFFSHTEEEKDALVKIEDILPEVQSQEIPNVTELVLEEENLPEVHGSGDIVAFSSSSLEAHANLEEPFSFFSDTEEEKETLRKIEDYLPKVQSEETPNVTELVFEEENLPEAPETILIPNPAEIFPSIIVEDSQVNGEDTLHKQSKAFGDPSDEGKSHHASQNDRDDKSFAEDIESTKSNEHSISQTKGSVPKESSLSAGEGSKGLEVQVSATQRRYARKLLPIGTKSGLSILVAAVIAAIYFASASRKRRRISCEVVAEKPSVKFIAKKEPQRANCNYSPTPEPMEKAYSRMHFSSSRISPPQVQFLAEYLPEEVSSSDRNMSRMNAQENSFQTHDRRFRRGNSFSSATPQDYTVTSEFSSDSPSYGSFTTYEKIARKEGGGDEEPKVLKVVTPVRRSSRIRKQAMSP